MAEILQNASRDNLISAIENNILGLIGAYRNWPRATVYSEKGINWSMTDIPFAQFNSIICLDPAQEKIGFTVERIIDQARTKKVPVLWWVGPSTHTTKLGETLENNGFTSQSPMTGMAVDLDYLRDDLTLAMNLDVVQVSTLQTRRQWSGVCAASFSMPDFAAIAFEQVIKHANPEHILAFVGRQNDQPVATSLLILSAGVAGIYYVSTLPEARGQGIGATLTVAALQEARKRGYKISILHATKMSMNIYRSLGFLEYCKIVPYQWSPIRSFE
jgi:GNAT superfamily N-acetyltransferase